MATSEQARKAASERMKAMHAKKREEKNAVITEEIAPQLKAVRDVAQRPSRNLFNGNSQRLAVLGDVPGYHLRWFNDEPGRIQMAIQSGWDHVDQKEIQLTASRRVTETNADLGSHVTTQVSNDKDSSFHKAVLMKIRKEYYDESQKEMQDLIDAKEQSMLRSGGFGKVDNAYVPKTHSDGRAIHMSTRKTT